MEDNAVDCLVVQAHTCHRGSVGVVAFAMRLVCLRETAIFLLGSLFRAQRCSFSAEPYRRCQGFGKGHWN